MRKLIPLLAILAVGLVSALPAATLGDQGTAPEIVRYHAKVTVHTQPNGGGGSSGKTRVASGTVINSHGIVVTAAHVARSIGNTAEITTSDGGVYDARILRVMPETDLAVLQMVEPRHLELEAPLAGTGTDPGEPVRGIGLRSNGEVAIRQGFVRPDAGSSRFRFGAFGFREPLVLELPVGSGFSGGPVFNGRGRWLGMIIGYELVETEAGERVSTGKTYVLPAGRILELVEELR